MTIKNSNSDIIITSLSQADGILSMLADAGKGDDFGTSTHQTVMNAIWSVQELLGQAAAAAASEK